MPKSRRSKACDIRKDVKQAVWERDDHCCILCGKPVAMQYANAHYIPRSQGGLGIEQNVVTMCFDCHFRQHNTDEGDKIFRFIGQHLHKCYPGLDDSTLRYSKEGL